MKNIKDKIIFIPGLTERMKDYRDVFPMSVDILPIDWNVCKLPKKGYKTVVGFSMGAVLALEYALKYRVDTLILCSMTPMVGQIKGIKAKKVIMMVGEKEPHIQAVLNNYRKMSHALKDKWTICVVPKAIHKIGKEYTRTILSFISHM